MGKLTISMAIFNSYVKLPEGKCLVLDILCPASLGWQSPLTIDSGMGMGHDLIPAMT